MDAHRLGCKVFAGGADAPPLTDFIPVFHRWIQQQSLDDMLIDVADYAHVDSGPGTLLVAHQGNYGMDETGDRRGLVYYSKHPLDGDMPQRLEAVCRKALTACRLLEQDEALNGAVRFDGSALQVFINDRIAAPNTDHTYEVFQPILAPLLEKLYPDTGYKLEREPDPRERFAVTITADTGPGVEELLRRLGAAD